MRDWISGLLTNGRQEKMCFTWAEENQFSSDFCPLLSEKTFKMFYINQLFCGNLQSPFHRYYRHFRIFFAWENVFVFPLSTNPLLMSVSAVWKLMKIKKKYKINLDLSFNIFAGTINVFVTRIHFAYPLLFLALLT